MAACRDYFEVTISPPVARPPPVERSPVLKLAPFSPVPKVDFDGIKLGTITKREVIIWNPTSGNIIIDLVVPGDMVKRGFCLNALRFNLAPDSQTNLEIEWKPIESGQWRDTIRVIHVNGKSKFSYISVTSSSINLSKRPPLRRILQPTANDRRNIKPFPNNEALKKSPPKISKKKLNTTNLKDESLNKKLEETSENFVVGFLPECNLSPVRDSRTTYVKHPGFPLYECNIPVIHSNEDEIKHFDATYMHGTKDAFTQSIVHQPKNLDREYIDLESKDLSLELSDMHFSMVSLSNEKHRRPSSASLIDDDRYEMHTGNFERDSLENPSLSPLMESGFRGLLGDVSRPQTPPLSSDVTLFNFGLSKSLTKFNSTTLESSSRKIKKKSPSLLPLVISSSKSTVISSTAKKRKNQEDLICTLSPKSRVQFKKGPRRLFNPGKGNNICAEHIMFTPGKEDQKCLKLLTSSEKNSHPLGFYHETSYENPFAKNAIHTSAFLEKQTFELIKWLNSVLTPPEEFNSEDCGVNIEKLWKKSITSDVLLLAPTKEEISSKYHSDEGRLMCVRKAAIALYESDRIAKVLHGIYAKIEIGFLDVKDDIDLYCDQGVRYKLVQLILYYNPLWLRIGLETIFNQIIQMPSKNSIAALIYFIKKHFLSDDEIIKKNTYSKSTSYKMPNFKREMNNFIVFKFLTLVFFLDQAKTERLIPYDPCLFQKSALIKESEGILNEFIKDFIKCVGAQKRTLASVGYCLKHKQTYLDEFDFSLLSFQDLRDGIRLARAMEIILKKNCLSPQLRTPAVSRLQKVHNVKVTLETLRNEGFIITEDITANDIVDGHKEKIMSLLWQILHRFLGPRYLRSAIIIQKWWRKTLPKVLIKREKEDAAATKIQAWWRGILLRKRLHLIIDEVKKDIQNRREACIKIQRWYRCVKAKQIEMKQFQEKRYSAVVIQRWYRSVKTKQIEKKQFQEKRNAAVVIQRWYRNVKAKQIEKKQLREKRNSVVVIQRWYRSVKAMQIDKKQFQEKRYSAVVIQRWYRSVKAKQIEMKQFQEKRNAAVVIKRWYRSVKAMQIEKKQFQEKRNAAVVIQRWYRSVKAMQIEKKQFQEKRNSAVVIQRWYRSVKAMQIEKKQFQEKRNSAVVIKRWYRSVKAMQIEKKQFQEKRNAAVVIQRWYRSVKAMQIEKKQFLEKRNSAVVIQRWYRSVKAMQIEKKQFQEKRNSAVVIQRWYRSVKAMQIEKKQFQEKRNAAVVIQRWYRSVKAKQIEKKQFQEKRNAAVVIQRWYRSVKAMQIEKKQFQEKRNAAVVIQRWYRSVKAKQIEKKQFQEKRNAAVVIQRWYRSVKTKQIKKKLFQEKRNSAVVIQRWYRSVKAMQIEKKQFQEKRNAAVVIQRWYRSVKAKQIENKQFQEKKNSAVVIQRWYRSGKAKKIEKKQSEEKRKAAGVIQRWYRSVKSKQNEKKQFQEKRNATVAIQRWYRGCISTRVLRKCFLEKRNASVKIQTWFRFIVNRRKGSKQYLAAVIIQSVWRGFIWRKKNEHVIQDIKKKSEEAVKAASLGFSNQRLTDLFDETIEVLAVDNLDIKQFKVLFNTMRKLDYCTLYSPVLCEKLGKIQNFFVIAWVTLNKQTRSDPYIKVFEHIINILVNLARFDNAAAIYESFSFFNGHHILAALMGKSLEKHACLFCKCVSLLWILVSKDERTAKTLTSDLEFMKRLNFYYKQINKKTQKKKSQNREIPQLVTDWGYKRFTKEFSDESVAMTSLFQILKISIPR
ncbi:hypothetical protein O3M35_013008 [Rhynocoris fuscipes]|uniref:Calponin-homology (CH) domain-containing protein n=1 Tax=Rhynocoris fuscipes TaxID=488301 RepID=A0AAW1CF94_9HEMI